MCDMNCLECVHGDCINNSPATLQERNLSKELDNDCKEVVVVEDMTRYIHNRIDKEDYLKARNKEYEAKRKGRKDIREQKRKQYQNHREKKLAYQHQYYAEHREEITARQRAEYADNKEVFSERNKKYYEEHKDQVREANNRWKEEHQEQYLEYQRQYHKTPKCRAKQKQYYEDNKDTIKAKQRAYREPVQTLPPMEPVQPLYATQQISEMQYQPSYRLVSAKPKSKEQLILNKFPYILGKCHEQVDGVIYSDAVSKVHAEFIEKQGVLYVADMSSTNGTYVNHKRIASNQWVSLRNGDHIQIADKEYCLCS